MRMKTLTVALMLLIQSIAPAQDLRIYDFVVAKDGSGDYLTIQEAVNACRDYSEHLCRIFVKNGVYWEKLMIPSWKARITFIGQNVDSVRIEYNDYSGKLDGWGIKLNTFTSHTCFVGGNDITFENMTFVNSAGRVGQAVAMHVEGDRVVFKNCKFIGDQDTLFAAGDNSRQYFLDCSIEGTTDFIFGPSTAVFERCTILSKKDSYVTAASTPAAREYGFVFLDCRLLRDSSATKVYLGRPWRSCAYTAFINCYLDSHIRPEGWHNWSKPEAEATSRYYEYNSTGPGANPASRVPWSHHLTAAEAREMTARNILKGFDNWDPTK